MMPRRGSDGHIALSQDGGQREAAPSNKMAASEKRRPSPAAAGSDLARPALSANGAAESEAEFLLHAGVTDMVREALLKVLETRPEEPIDFLAGYFENLMQSSPEAEAAEASLPAADGVADSQRLLQMRLDRALWYLSLAHHSHRTAFNNNVSMAYESLATSRRRKKPGVNGKLYSELLQLICQAKGTPEEVALPLLQKVACRDHEAVPFDIFRYGALTCLVLLEFLAKANMLFDALDGGSGSADKHICMAVLGALEDALRTTNVTVPIRYLEAGSKLGPDSLALAMDQALAKQKSGVAMKKEEFLQRASAIFVARVKPVD
ncbi:tubulin polyglutamylase complex subunit 1 isoform X2 [Rhineura floridana]|uniref:tubulin polyglutamylase complex subunit 1 isoform X2 n=1 Tax=Rhineura floridana TaxID=261503 RepID=UPI002AC87D48|nr:tubulin polyglutamylase complex subunit 1 isoform X2 [Rhineura floridana]